MIDCPSEPIACEECQQCILYWIIHDFFLDEPINMRFVLIYHPELCRYNLYMIDLETWLFESRDANEIVTALEALPLEVAQMMYRNMDLDETNYGF